MGLNLINETTLPIRAWTKQLPSVLTCLKVNQKPKVWVEDVFVMNKG